MGGPQIGSFLSLFLSRFPLFVVCTQLRGHLGAGAESVSLGSTVFPLASFTPASTFAHTEDGLGASLVVSQPQGLWRRVCTRPRAYCTEVRIKAFGFTLVV